ncbi:acetoin dehydrogenase dihydrolipoyllysine-residue acetyltransferase subunit [Paraburkholderia sp. DHOC27]|uniref:acetoin dehydrogenase dihydrolipoyllysine-residue acetyltransferase subunit n=1 Tax=Paraburkholderia sp. DHOC27 TaxID=2303330 RepID=UPI000E3D44F0|nr:acetoin dehydrogenase dihydrolipoyllysine-residue acetyltransferase subunit [Paraburkholderia sp. DHOC27]RFU49390.1 acetoin dehydrogenase dihydrolipoyllysine-residue acetyltransferase subunit [Paraburkholderia sp. DHOC27]
MPTEVILPRVDMDMTEGMIAAWHVSEGDEVREGTLIFEIETSKATMEIDAPASGIIRQINAPVGKTVPVGTAVAWIYAAGEALVERDGAGDQERESGADDAAVAASQGEAEQVETTQAEGTSDAVEALAPNAPQPLRATPAARRLAREHGLWLVDISGSGPHGRVAAQDVLRKAALTGESASGGTLSGTRGGTPSGTRHAPLHSITLRKGSGDPLVLLHGFAAESNSWRPFSQAVARIAAPTQGMLAIDLPAHGKSSADAAGSLEEMVGALAQTLLDAGITRCHLVGHSFGGALALALASNTLENNAIGNAKRPHLEIASLTLLAPAGLGPESNGAFIRGVTQATQRASLAAWLKQLFANPARMDEGFLATAVQQLEPAEVRERLAAVAGRFFPDGTQALDLRHLLHDLTMPVRVVWGQQDRILPVRHTEGLPGHVAVHRFDGVGHLPYLEAQAEVARVVVQNIAAASTVNALACAARG